MSNPRRLCRRALGLFYQRYVHWRISRPSETRVFGRRVLTAPNVFHPKYFLSTTVLIDYLATLDLSGRTFLEMGTGSGAVALFAESRGAQVTACDLNPAAVALARRSAELNGAKLEILSSDLFSADALAGRRFEVVVFNLPFYPGVARSALDSAFYGGPDFETVRKFADNAARFLTPDGMLVVIFSEDSGRDKMLSILSNAGLVVSEERVTQRFFEQFHVLRLRTQASTAARAKAP